MTNPDPYHFALIGRAIAFLDESSADRPSLDQVAAAIGLSPAHFQRVFSQWVGVSPKRYQQYLTLNHAKALLRDRHTVLDATLDAGLSSAGRLHDLFTRWEAMTPGEFALAGAGLRINWGHAPSPFGDVLAMATERGLCGMAFTADTGLQAAFEDLRARWPKADYVQDQAAILPLVEASFVAGNRTRLHLIGAPFQIKVWEALLAIPSGHVTTYSDLALRVGNPKAVRAVGTAVGRNPVSWLIPCHRALRKSGELGGYHWGLNVKRAMLAWESARLEANDAA